MHYEFRSYIFLPSGDQTLPDTDKFFARVPAKFIKKNHTNNTGQIGQYR